ncbi:PAS domain S-box protein [Pararobbsia silviterrae]|uniref:hybrid sensor histidine kinase/response regulator n=1 Tax=Pararobbsia silviterrae TaxID=1792498 RepID=UPI00131435EA|nr:PAS domain S-box protein [Pararobbsia silviterrae]
MKAPIVLRHGLWPYVLAILATALMGATRWLLQPALGAHAPLLPFLFSLVVAAWFGGLEGGLAATVLGALTGMLLFMAPGMSLRLSHANDIVFVAFFLLIGTAICIVMDALRTTRERLIRSTALLEEEVRERRRVELDARRRRDWLSATLASIGEAVIVTDLEGTLQLMNREAEALTGYRTDEALGREFDALVRFVDGHTRKTLLSPVVRVLSGAAPRAPDAPPAWLEARNGVTLPIEENASLVLDDEGRPAGVVIVFRDVTQRQLAETRLRQSEKDLADFVENVAVALLRIDIDGTVVQANQAMLDMFGMRRDALLGRPFSEIWADRASFKVLIERLIAGETVRNFEGTLRAQNGEARAVLLDANAHHEGVRFQYARCVIRDISDRKRAEEVAARLLDNLRTADRKKDEFLAVLAHELRNPLAPIRASLEVLERATERATFDKARAIMVRQVDQMSRLVDDLLQISRITHNRLELRKDAIRLGETLDIAIDTARPLIDQRQHQLDVRLADTTLAVYADRARLAQVFSNLLNNAAKFTKPGGRISVDVERDPANPETATVTIRDNGIGIAADMLARVFETFSRVEPTSDDIVPGGLGLGLSLVQQLTRLHGGSVMAHSNGLGTGSTFVVRLPLVTPDAFALPRALPGDARGRTLRVLVVDDNMDAAQALGAMLELGGDTIELAYDGQAALEAIERFRPDAVFLDIGLPRLNGYEVAQRTRMRDWGARVLLIALTGYGQQKDVRLAEESGFDHHLVKPADPAAIDALLAALRRSAPRVAAS